MSDPLLDPIWKVREELIKKHGGPKGYFDDVVKRDKQRRRREQAAKARKGRKTAAKASKS